MSYNLFNTNIGRVERFRDGSFFYETIFGSRDGSGYKDDAHKLRSVLSSPAALTVAKLQSDMLSLGMIKAYNSNDKEVDNDPLIKLLENPNPFQTSKQFLWDYSFHLFTFGVAYLYTSSKVIKEDTNLYWLNPSRFIWDDKLNQKLDKIALSKGTVRDIQKLTIYYKNEDGTKTPYSLGDIKPFFDLTNGLGNWYNGSGTLDALYKVIQNSETGLDAKFSNLDYSGKFTVTGKTKSGSVDLDSLPMSEAEKNDTKGKLNGKQRMHVLKSPIEVNRFVENMAQLELDKSYFSDVYKVGKIRNIPRNVLEASLEDSNNTSQNVRESKAGWIEQSIMPMANDLMNGLETIFGYREKDIDLVMTYEHLSFMQVFRDMRQEAITKEIANIQTAKEMGALSESEAISLVKRLINE